MAGPSFIGHIFFVFFERMYGRWDRRQRRKRLDALARDGRTEIPVVLTDMELTNGQERAGKLAIGGPQVLWREKGQAEAVFEPGPLTMAAVDQEAVTFQAGRTELRIHPDEAPHVLKALDASPLG